ncbi:GT4 family glycosyltransferase PelF [Sulfurimonas sp. HSL-1716]|uniref:GT4 family glycosyltransferase PelF n=1 Tax=Hydrocurvibacter sulfurireducens TaxID=3131937 RepID=UPI0031F79D9E
MTKYIRKSSSVDVMLLAEGTYPYIGGGVSSWIAQILEGMKDIRFGICFLGSVESDYGGLKYELPDNLVHLEVHYLFEENTPEVKRIKGDEKAFETIENLYASFKDKSIEIPKEIKNIDFYLQDMTFEDFLYSKKSWEFINKIYFKNAPDVSFIDYFWTLRDIHKPVWTLAKIVKHFPDMKILHAPSTGYAGFLGALASYDRDTGLVLTEHGIYTRERKIDMLSAEWIDFKKPALLKQPEEFNYIKKMWIEFFRIIGEFAYEKADIILSLYPEAQNIQIALGADARKTRVLPNGVDVDAIQAVMKEKQKDQKPVISLIGRVVSIKDIKTFIRAMRITVNQIPDVEAWIVGPTDEDKEYFTECEHMIESLGLTNNMRFLGFRNIKEILPHSTLLTLTSISEGMPLVILEGFAAGIPCVATDVGSCKNLIEGGLNDEDRELGLAGAITSIANPGELAKHYIRFLTDEEARKKAGDIALRRVEKYYSQEIFLKEYHEIYMNLINKKESL